MCMHKQHSSSAKFTERSVDYVRTDSNVSFPWNPAHPYYSADSLGCHLIRTETLYTEGQKV